MRKVAIVGAGAAGYFAAIQLAEHFPEVQVKLYEKSTPLAKVKVSGGGRCNVTHACFDPKELIAFYPRGGRELLGPFHHFQPGDMMEWLERRGVDLKIEEDGRVFPVSNQSQSIIDCFARSLPEGVMIQQGVKDLIPLMDGQWEVVTQDNACDQFDAVLVTTGSSELVWKMLVGLGVAVIDRVPSLFTFNIALPELHALAGLSIPVRCRIAQFDQETEGPMLVTHWGLSGPAILKMSALAARFLAEQDYQFNVEIHSLPLLTDDAIDALIQQARRNMGKKQIRNYVPFQFPLRWWQFLLREVDWADKNWGDIKKDEMQFCLLQLTRLTFNAKGKTTFKEEFVTAGGVDLRSVNFKTMESKTHKGLYFAGEVLNIDGVTGGFNFQSCWTTAYLAAQGMGQE
jgi:predicted Rossmann fold flavoprotein